MIFPVCRGARQDCPLSPLLYALYMEPVAERIRKRPLIHGITITRTEHKIALYADVILALSEPLVSFPTSGWV